MVMTAKEFDAAVASCRALGIYGHVEFNNEGDRAYIRTPQEESTLRSALANVEPRETIIRVPTRRRWPFIATKSFALGFLSVLLVLTMLGVGVVG